MPAHDEGRVADVDSPVLGEQDVLLPVALDRVRYRVTEGVPVLHLVSSRLRRARAAAEG